MKEYYYIQNGSSFYLVGSSSMLAVLATILISGSWLFWDVFFHLKDMRRSTESQCRIIVSGSAYAIGQSVSVNLFLLLSPPPKKKRNIVRLGKGWALAKGDHLINFIITVHHTNF